MSQDKPSNQQNKLIHWADFAADRIIRQNGEKETYTLASGITPSGVVHFGNFRETITVDLVARALRNRGKNVRFIFSWDDYDTFRKIPANMPKQDLLKNYMFQPIVDTPDPYEKEESYAAHHEKNYESQLQKVGIAVEPIYQAKKYKSGDYNENIIKTLKNTNKIKEILNVHRSTPLPPDWLPVSLYCEKCNTDKMKLVQFNGEDSLNYECENCGFEGNEDLETSKRVKLPWRLDWPMRWVYENVDFEPGGKDHSSQGGSFSTGKELVKEIYGGKPPIYLQYDFVSIKGGSGKMSSSSGEVVTVNDVLEVYEPEILRYIFASYKTNIDFSVSFDLDVLKVYEDFDKAERLSFGVEQGNEKKAAMAKRVYELSQIIEPSDKCPIQPSFRHLCNIIQINDGDLNKAKKHYSEQIISDWDVRRLENRSKCAQNWLKNYAPEDFKFSVHNEPQKLELDQNQLQFFNTLTEDLKVNWAQYKTDKDLHEKLYEIMHSIEGLTPGDIFPKVYQAIIGKIKGPKLAGFLRTIGKERTINLLQR
jgi:lysyl-tRNA synthetase, class I